jgi:hypothetical protein
LPLDPALCILYMKNPVFWALFSSLPPFFPTQLLSLHRQIWSSPRNVYWCSLPTPSRCFFTPFIQTSASYLI